MKILTIQAAYFPMIGGAEVFHQKTAEYLVAKEHQVDVITCLWKKPDVFWRNWRKKEEILNGVNIHRVKPWFYRQYLKSIGAIWPLYKKALQLIKVNKYDLIHAHIFPSSVIGALIKKKTNLPLIITVQGGDVADYSETGRDWSWLLEPFISWSLRQADIVHVVSNYMEEIVKKLGVKRVKMIPNGVDSSLYKPRDKKKLKRKYRISQNKFVIISHSRLTPKNGLDLLIKSINKFSDKHKILLLLVGGGEQEKSLKQLVKKLKLEKQVRFLGYQSKEKTAELLSMADLFVRPSRNEGFGIAFLEAMASGLAVIGTNQGGIKELIKPGREGLLISVREREALTLAIDNLRKNNELRKKMGQQGRRKVIKSYSWNTITNDLEEIYKQVKL